MRNGPAIVLLMLSMAAAAGGHAEEPQPFPAGVYTFSIAAEEAPAEVPSDILPLLVGNYVVTFTPDGHVTNMVSGKLDAKGRYASTPAYLVITDEEGPGHCQGERATGIYKWTLVGDSLTLTRVEDLCKWRAFAITRKTWRRG
jgi:hypothetical protein